MTQPCLAAPETVSADPLIESENLSLYYGNTQVLANICLSIKAGQITALVGPSGCGKTSFLISINRLTDLIPNCKVTGALRVGSIDALDPKTDVVALRRQVGMIFQKPNPFPLSIRKNLEFPLREHGMKNRGELADTVAHSLTDVGLWDEVKDRLNAPALALSGGQQQRLCIARALALNPTAILMDEPCSALDPISSGVVEELILSLKGCYTILVVTHNLAQARRIADHAALFWTQNGSGRLVEYGSSDQFFNNPAESLTASYLDGAKG